MTRRRFEYADMSTGVPRVGAREGVAFGSDAAESEHGEAPVCVEHQEVSVGDAKPFDLKSDVDAFPPPPAEDTHTGSEISDSGDEKP